MNNFENVLQVALSPYVSDPKWYPFILIGLAIVAIFIVYIIFMYIRSFMSWLFGVNELIALQKQNNELLANMIALQEENNEILNFLIEDAQEDENFDKISNNLDATSTNDVSDTVEIYEHFSEEDDDDTQKNNSEEIKNQSETTKKKKWFS